MSPPVSAVPGGGGAGAVAIAVLLDAALGEPPLRWHPVVWCGRYLSAAGDLLPSGPRWRATALGGTAWSLGAVAATTAGAVVACSAERLPRGVGTVLTGVALWPLLAGRLLLSEVAAVETALASSTEEGRAVLARLVSRDTTALTREEVRGAAIQSLAENLSDSFVAPLVWFATTGLPGAVLHRYANTADAMWGYRTPRWERAGTVAARVDDLLNLVPSRLTAALVGPPPERSWRPSYRPVGRQPLRRLRTEARRTPSPNGGWPMGAMALRLDVRLAKEGAYVLNPAGAEPQAHHLEQGLAAARRAAVTAAVVAMAGTHALRRMRMTRTVRTVRTVRTSEGAAA